MSVSILTPTQYSRRYHLPYLIKLIKSQTYFSCITAPGELTEGRIIQWTIVNGSQNEEDAIKYAEIINMTAQMYPELNITYIDWLEGRTFADMFNVGNNACIGDYIAIMEDDEYYFPTHISHGVKMLSKSDKLIAGCSDIYMYLSKDQILYKWKTISQNHSSNHALIYKREYCLTHTFTHNADKPFSIEPSFTNNFTEPMVQLDSSKCVIHILHDNNTFNWKQLIDEWIYCKIILVTSLDLIKHEDFLGFEEFVKTNSNLQHS